MSRYHVDHERIPPSLVEKIIGGVAMGMSDEEQTGHKVVVTDNETGDKGEGYGWSREEALGNACEDLRVSVSDIDS